MMSSDELNTIIERIASGMQTATDAEALRVALTDRSQDLRQLGKYNVNIGQGQDIHIGDRTYVTWNDEAIQALIEIVQKQHPKPTGIPANLPYSGVVEFVGRDAVMSQLHQMLQQGHRVAVSAIAGMGGVGKTELALQYALKYQLTYPAGICWLSARGVDVGTQIVQFGRSLLDLNPPEDVELIEQVKFCWRHWQSGEVLLVFDDVTDYAAIKPYLPPSTAPRFKVLITTRLRLGASVNQLELEVLDESAALALLESLVGSERIHLERDCAQQLCAQLGYLPLGLELVGRYLARKPDLSLAVMLQRLQDKRLAALALRQTEDDMTAQLGVAAAFELSWEVLSESAKPLGYLLSLFAAAPIPWLMIEDYLSDECPDEIEENRDTLLNLHLLDRVAPDTYQLHPLIQEFLRTKLETYSENDKLKRNFCGFIGFIAKAIPSPLTLRAFDEVVQIIPHVEEAIKVLTNLFEKEDISFVFIALGNFYEEQGDYKAAKILYKKCLINIRKSVINNHFIITSLNHIASFYYDYGEYEDAIPLLFEALDLSRKIFGENHSEVAYGFHALASIYHAQKNYPEACSLYSKAISIRKNLSNEDSLSMAISLNNLAALYKDQGLYTEAENIYLKVGNFIENLIDQVNVMITEMISKLEKNETAIRQIGLFIEYCISTIYPFLCILMNNLAGLYCEQELYDIAENLYLDALEIYGSFFGKKKIHAVKILNNLVKLYLEQERYEDAEATLKKIANLEIEPFSETYEEIASSFEHLAYSYREKKRYKEAENHVKYVLKIRKNVFGEKHPLVCNTLNNLALLCKDQNRYKEAENLLLGIIDLNKYLFDEDDLEVATSLSNLAYLYCDLGRYGEAEPLLQRALGIFIPTVGKSHPDVGRVSESLATLHAAQGHDQVAEALYVEALEILEQGLGAEHPWTIRCRENLAQLRNRS